MGQPAIELSHVTKRFRLGQTHDSLGDWLRELVCRRGENPLRDGRTFQAVDDVNFTIESGEAVGIIGPNGAGKSTVLKLLSRILRPDSGVIRVRGRMAGLIEVGAGFHGDLTGRENVYLNGAILGMSRGEVRRKFDQIVAFAGLERFLDLPVKRYSSGMYARLGFSIASHVEAEVLLVDEALSVGDAVFRLRCLDRMRNLVRKGTTLVFVTHDLDQMQSICARTIVLDQGRVAFAGAPGEAVGRYLHAVSRTHAVRNADLSRPGGAADVRIEQLRLFKADGQSAEWFCPREPVTIRLEYSLPRAVPDLVVEFNLRSTAGHAVLSLNSGRDESTIRGRAGRNCLTLTIADVPLSGGQYFWNVRMWDAESGACELDTPFCYPMVLNNEQGRASGLVSVERTWAAQPVGPSNADVGADSGQEPAPAMAGV